MLMKNNLTCQMFVRCEKAWIDAIEKHIDYSDLIDDYIFAGLTNFEMYDNTPVLLKAILFNRFASWISADVAEFKEWYNDIYLNAGRDTVTSKLN